MSKMLKDGLNSASFSRLVEFLNPFSKTAKMTAPRSTASAKISAGKEKQRERNIS